MKIINPQHQPPFYVQQKEFEREIEAAKNKSNLKRSILSHSISFVLGVASGLLVAFLVNLFGWV